MKNILRLTYALCLMNALTACGGGGSSSSSSVASSSSSLASSSSSSSLASSSSSSISSVSSSSSTSSASSSSSTSSVSLLPTYHITEIVPLAGYSGVAVDINDSNVVVGSARNGSASPASYGFYWTASGGAVLVGSLALGVTNSGDVIIQNIDAYSVVQSTLLDSSGTAAGFYQANSSSPYPVFFSHTGAGVNANLYWSGPTTTTATLAGLTGATSVSAQSINTDGQIVGYATTASGIEPIYWSTPTAAPVAMQGLQGEPIAISSDGKIIGVKQGLTTLYYWSSFAAAPVPITLPNSALIPVQINKDGIFVGQVQANSTAFAMVGTAATGPVDLATRLDSSGTGWTLDYAEAINDNGVIVGYGTAPDGKAAAYIAVPN